MKNPWMSLWLSAYHQTANGAKGQFAAEMARQQNAFMKAWTEQAVSMWMQTWFPWSTHDKQRRRR